MSQFISLQTAIDMTTLYRSNREDILKTEYQNQKVLAICETFDKGQVQMLLNKEGCEAIRVYYGMDGSLKVHAILVAVNGKGEDILPAASKMLTTDDEGDIIEQAQRCPDDCPPESPLNP